MIVPPGRTDAVVALLAAAAGMLALLTATSAGLVGAVSAATVLLVARLFRGRRGAGRRLPSG